MPCASWEWYELRRSTYGISYSDGISNVQTTKRHGMNVNTKSWNSVCNSKRIQLEIGVFTHFFYRIPTMMVSKSELVFALFRSKYILKIKQKCLTSIVHQTLIMLRNTGYIHTIILKTNLEATQADLCNIFSHYSLLYKEVSPSQNRN